MNPAEATGDAPLADSLAAAVSRVTRPLVVLGFVVVVTSAPLAYFVLAREAEAEAARSSAREIALVVSREFEERPVLWRYDTPKLLRHLWVYGRRHDLGAVELRDADGRAIDLGLGGAPPRRPLVWASAPLKVHDAETGRVWVGVSLGSVWRNTWILLGGFAALGLLLSGVLYVVPMRALRSAEARLLASRRLRGASGRAMAAHEAERRAIARELHDGAGQSLTALRIELELLKGEPADPGRVRTHVERAAALTDQVLEDIRRALAELAPQVLDEVGLEGALRRLVDDARERLGIEATFHPSSAALPPLPRTVELAAYRVAQEALTNVAKHAEAGAVHVTLAVDGDAMVIAVEDDGRGLPRAPGGEGGRGIPGMRERAELLGGTLRVYPGPEGGTCVVAHLPLRPEGDPAA